MKSPEKQVVEIILLLALACALAVFPFVARACPGMQQQPPAFSEVDADGDGYISESEFDAFRAARHEQMAAEGKPMKGMATAPSFQAIDTDHDGKLSEAEFTAAQQAHRKAMHASHGEHGKGEGMKMPTFADLDLDGDGCISPEEFARHQAEMHGNRGQ